MEIPYLKVFAPLQQVRGHCQISALMSLLFSEGGEEMLFFRVRSSHPLMKLPKKVCLWGKLIKERK